MIFANFCPPPPEETRLVAAEDVSGAVENLIFRCPCCGAQVFPRGGENNRRHFFGRHAEHCTLGTARGKFNVALVKVGFSANIEAIVARNDPPFSPPSITPPTCPKPNPRSGPEEDPNEDENFEIRAVFHGLRNAKTLYDNLWGIEETVPISLDGKLTVGDLVVRRGSKSPAKAEFHDQFRLFKAVRVNTSAPYPKKKGYIVLRAVEIGTRENPVFLLIRFSDAAWHREYFNKIAGNENTRDKHKYIVLLARWLKEPSWPGEAYFATVNTYCVHFAAK